MPQHASPYPTLWSTRQTRIREQALSAQLPPSTLMQRAGAATARLALALAPHARTIWVACGPGNNGGDGLEAAILLAAAGKTVCITLLGSTERRPDDAAQALQRALAAGLRISEQAPEHYDLAIDALWGIGLRANLALVAGSLAADWMERLLHSEAMVLAVDIPSGLLADTGALAAAAAALAPPTPRGPRYTLSMLGLHPGLFTHQGSDWAGQVWLAPLQADSRVYPADAPQPNPAPADGTEGQLVTHIPTGTVCTKNAHKGLFGDVAVVGGAAGMEGAAVLAATAALHSGAGRVMLHLLGQAERPAALAPDIMLRDLTALSNVRGAMVAGCGGGTAIAAALAQLLAHANALVLDADALNAIAQSNRLQAQLRARAARHATVLTPHPLELARLLGVDTAQVQADRIAAASHAAQRWQCIVVLKGSGSIIAAPDGRYAINHSGNARLSIAGTGDVLAGCLGAQWAPLPGDADWQQAWQPTLNAVWLHGRIAELWPRLRPDQPTLTALALAQALPRPPWAGL